MSEELNYELMAHKLEQNKGFNTGAGIIEAGIGVIIEGIATMIGYQVLAGDTVEANLFGLQVPEGPASAVTAILFVAAAGAPFIIDGLYRVKTSEKLGEWAEKLRKAPDKAEIKEMVGEMDTGLIYKAGTVLEGLVGVAGINPIVVYDAIWKRYSTTKTVNEIKNELELYSRPAGGEGPIA